MCVDDQLLNTYLDQELKEPWKTQVEEHLSYCNACRLRLSSLKEIQSRLASATLSDDEIAPSKERVLTYFEKNRFGEQANKHLFWHKRVQVKLAPAILTSAAAFVVVFIASFVLFSSNPEQRQEILPGVADPIDSTHIRQVSDAPRPSLDSFSLEQIINHLDKLGYAVKLELKAITPLE